jgi:hypothetical protein
MAKIGVVADDGNLTAPGNIETRDMLETIQLHGRSPPPLGDERPAPSPAGDGARQAMDGGDEAPRTWGPAFPGLRFVGRKCIPKVCRTATR